MKQVFIGCGMFFTALLVFSGCKKEKTLQGISQNNINDSLTDRERLSLQIFGNTEFKFNKNDSNYLNALKRLSKNLFFSGKNPSGDKNELINSCSLNGGDSTYGWYSDPDSVIIEGPYKSAKKSRIRSYCGKLPRSYCKCC